VVKFESWTTKLDNMVLNLRGKGNGRSECKKVCGEEEPSERTPGAYFSSANFCVMS
jgi:hypothetical protein